MKVIRLNFYINATIGNVPSNILCGNRPSDVIKKLAELNGEAEGREPIVINRIFYVNFTGKRFPYLISEDKDGNIGLVGG